MADVTDMRGYVKMLEEMGELRLFEGVDLNLEVGALTERAAEKEGPALLFSGFKGFAKGFPRDLGTLLTSWNNSVQGFSK